MASREQSVYCNEGKRNICRGLKQETFRQQCATQTAETKYAGLGGQECDKSIFCQSTEVIKTNRSIAPCRPYLPIKRKIGQWSDSTREFTGTHRVRELSQKQLGLRYSLVLRESVRGKIKSFPALRVVTKRQKIWDISKIPLPLTDLIGTDSNSNEYYEWTQDELAAPSITNAVIDGSEQEAATNDTSTGARVGNHSQTSIKNVRVSTRAIESDTIGRANELSYQVMMRQQELKRDMEATMLSNNPSVAGTDAVAGQSGGLNAWLETNNAAPAVGYTAGGFNTGTGIVDAMVPGTAEALTETKVRDVAENIFTEGGNPTVCMMVPKVCRLFSEYLFSSSARVATLTAETGQSKSAATAKGSINIFVTDFGVTLDLIPNRLQQNTDTDVSTAFLIDAMHLRQSFLHSPRTEPLAKTGLSEKRMMSADWTLVVTTEKAHGCIPAIDNTAAVTA